MSVGAFLVRCAAVLWILFLTSCAQTLPVTTDPIPLLVEVDQQAIIGPSDSFLDTRRARLVRLTNINPDALRVLPRGAGAKLSLLLEGELRTATGLSERQVFGELRVWSGLLSDGGTMRVTYRPNGSAVVRVQSSKGNYLVEQSSPGGPFALMELDTGFDEGGIDFVPSPASSSGDSVALRKCDSRPEHGIPIKPGPRVDFLLVYTAAAAANSADIEASIVSAFDGLTTAFSNSPNFGTQTRIVGLRQIGFVETGSMKNDLTTITNLPAVTSLRNRTSADVVSLVGKYSDYCGMGWLNENVSPAASSHAFSVVHYGCLPGNTLAHEVGHTFGMRHDLYVDGAGSNNHGYVLLKRSVRTIMAYNDQCAAAGKDCQRLTTFSTADDSIKGDPIGGLRADNREVLCNASSVVAAFR